MFALVQPMTASSVEMSANAKAEEPSPQPFPWIQGEGEWREASSVQACFIGGGLYLKSKSENRFGLSAGLSLVGRTSHFTSTVNLLMAQRIH